MPIRVIQWATGGVGRAAIEGVLAHPDLELVGAWVHSADKNGRDVGELIGAAPIGVTATTDADTLLASEADCVVYSPLMADPHTVRAILSSGKNIVTPLGWFYPKPTEREKLDTVCRMARVSLHGTGIHPGGITERLPLMLSSLSGSVTAIRAEEYSDIRTYGTPEVVRDWMLFGSTPEQAATSAIVAVLGSGYSQSVRMLADEVGFDLDQKLRVTHETAVATKTIDSPIGPIEPGHVAAQRFRWDGTVGDEPVITAAVNWFMGEHDLDPPWTLGTQGERFEIEITGDPGCLVTISGMHPQSVDAGLVRNPAVVATAMHCVNSIPYVVAAEPGVRTYLDLPLMSGRAAPNLNLNRKSFVVDTGLPQHPDTCRNERLPVSRPGLDA
ncbi:NAD(P)H-dependent amine dehydrogenase family protein [Nocardia pseudovaccinii]|uniref:NAD(P)H-dependent amine dehydrogenase family protein n=1 Tax=Nocardia pseudovaccinii TaxID=189540 RepID=UPI0007C7D587|nr:dihydrodipicolinate reductase [Nocardia pseudovaccinii]